MSMFNSLRDAAVAPFRPPARRSLNLSCPASPRSTASRSPRTPVSETPPVASRCSRPASWIIHKKTNFVSHLCVAENRYQRRESKRGQCIDTDRLEAGTRPVSSREPSRPVTVCTGWNALHRATGDGQIAKRLLDELQRQAPQIADDGGITPFSRSLGSAATTTVMRSCLCRDERSYDWTTVGNSGVRGRDEAWEK